MSTPDATRVMTLLQSRIAVSLCAAAATMALVPVASAAAPTFHVVNVNAHADRRVSASSSTRPGLTRVRAVGPEDIELFQPRARASVSTLVADFDYALHHNSLVRLQRDFSFVGEVDAGFDGYLPLSRGTVYIIDGDGPDGSSYRAADIATLLVTGPRINASAPPSDRIDIAKNGTPSTHAMTTGRRYVSLVNSGAEAAVAAVRIATSVSNAAIKRFLSHPSFSGLQTLSTGQHPDNRIAQDAPASHTVVLRQFLTAGRYVVLVLHYPRGRLQNDVPRNQATSFTLH